MDDKKKIIQQIMEETGNGERLATIMAGRIPLIRPELQPCVAAWKNKRRLPFSYQGITLDEIMEKERKSYLEAVFSMQVLMENPNLAMNYKRRKFTRE